MFFGRGISFLSFVFYKLLTEASAKEGGFVLFLDCFVVLLAHSALDLPKGGLPLKTDGVRKLRVKDFAKNYTIRNALLKKLKLRVCYFYTSYGT